MDDLPPVYPSPARMRISRALNRHWSVILAELLALAAVFALRGPLHIQIFLVILLAWSWFSVWLRVEPWSELGLRRPRRWRSAVLSGVATGALYQAFSVLALFPLLDRWLGAAPDLSEFQSVRGDVLYLLGALILSWTWAAFAEEIVFRGYLLNRALDLFGRKAWGWLAAALVSALFFGWAHAYQGWPGVVDNALFGLALAALYRWQAGNLIPVMVAHGTLNSIGFILIFLGYAG